MKWYLLIVLLEMLNYFLNSFRFVVYDIKKAIFMKENRPDLQDLHLLRVWGMYVFDIVILY